MISILAQERVLGAALGTAFTGFIVFQQRKDIYDTVAKSQPKPPKSQKELTAALVGLIPRILSFMSVADVSSAETGGVTDVLDGR
ncbi:hypothetical protein CTI12_AA304510 [Artemisia annua]|uniref:Uncharacterized protein n=1 Tax=Artemisia annua TaxID=35608 RepID=A0A2U1N5W8_ARTAN|nr:hypothetical protein CTI12_AA304510 [Artemisia annua]